MGQVKFNYSKTAGYVHEHEVESMKALTESARKLLLSKSGAGNDYLGWIDLPVDYDKEEFARIKKAAEKIKSDSDVLVVIGIGGSYLGARAAIEFLGHNFFNSVSKDLRKAPEIYFVGNSISSNYLAGLVDVTSDCSPVVIFFKVSFPSFISFSPTIATKGICLSLAYPICFFILEASG